MCGQNDNIINCNKWNNRYGQNDNMQFLKKYKGYGRNDNNQYCQNDNSQNVLTYVKFTYPYCRKITNGKEIVIL